MLISYELNIYSGFRFYSFKWCTFQLVWWCIFQLVYTYVGTHTSLYLDLYYYFSPQLRLAAEGNLGYRYSERDSYNGWTGNFVLTLTYSLF